MIEVNTMVLENGIEYTEIDNLIYNNIKYVLLSNINNVKDSQEIDKVLANMGMTRLDTDKELEVGTKIILGTVNGVDTIARQTLSAKTFTYGYKLGENGTYNSGKVYTEALLPIASGDTGVKNLKISFTKFSI